MKRFYMIVRRDPRGYDGPTVDEDVYDNVADAHLDARYIAKRKPGMQILIMECVGVHESIILPPRYTSIEQPDFLRLTAGVPVDTERSMIE